MTGPEQVAVYLDRVEMPRTRAFSAAPYVVGLAAGQDARRHDFQAAPAKSSKRGHAGSFDELALYPPGDPGEHVVLRMVVMESAAGFGRAAEIVGRGRELIAGTQVGRTIAAGVGLGSVGAASVALTEAVDTITNRLQRAGDVEVAVGEAVLRRPEGGWAVAAHVVEVGDDVRFHLRIETTASVTAHLAAMEAASRPAAETPLVEDEAEDLAAGAETLANVEASGDGEGG